MSAFAAHSPGNPTRVSGRRTWTSRVALALWTLSLVLEVGTVVLAQLSDPAAAGTHGYSTTYVTGQLIFVQAFSSVGALVAGRRPANPIGWLLCVGPILWGAASTAEAWSYFAAERALGGSAVVLALTSPAWLVGTALVTVYGFLVFPDGHVLSARWRPVPWAAGCLLVAIALGMILTAGEFEGHEGLENPFGVSGFDKVAGAAFVGLAALLAASIVSLVLRYRRATGAPRQQIKVVALTVCGVAVVLATAGALNLATSRAAEGWRVFTLVVFCCFSAVPVSIGVAILRYRLYEIDRLISRTLVYGSLTTILGAVYVGLVFGGQAVFSSAAGGGDLAIALSTLVVAALFRPLRARVQRVVDRRFYRRRYDAQHTLEAFSAGLRGEVDLQTMTSDLVRVVDQTMQPAHVSLWLRDRSP